MQQVNDCCNDLFSKWVVFKKFKFFSLVSQQMNNCCFDLLSKQDVFKNIPEFIFKTCTFVPFGQLYKNETLAQVVSGDFCDVFKNCYFVEHLQMDACEAI